MIYSAIIPIDGRIRRITFEAADEEDARLLAAKCGAGIEGPAAQPGVLPATPGTPEPLAYDAQTACKLLGGVSYTTLWRWVARGELDRVSGTRHVLITRKSLERKCRVTEKPWSPRS